jgi:hypothetical protein
MTYSVADHIKREFAVLLGPSIIAGRDVPHRLAGPLASDFHIPDGKKTANFVSLLRAIPIIMDFTGYSVEH